MGQLSTKLRNKMNHLALGILIVFIALCTTAGIGLTLRTHSADREIQAMGARLVGDDVTPIFGESCRGLLGQGNPRQCVHFAVYATDVTREGVKGTLVTLPNYFKTVSQGEIDGWAIFTYVNMNTDHRLTLDGNEMTGDRAGFQPPAGKRWNLVDQSTERNRSWTVQLYETNDNYNYEIDGQPVKPDNFIVLLRYNDVISDGDGWLPIRF